MATQAATHRHAPPRKHQNDRTHHGACQGARAAAAVGGLDFSPSAYRYGFYGAPARPSGFSRATPKQRFELGLLISAVEQGKTSVAYGPREITAAASTGAIRLLVFTEAGLTHSGRHCATVQSLGGSTLLLGADDAGAELVASLAGACALLRFELQHDDAGSEASEDSDEGYGADAAENDARKGGSSGPHDSEEMSISPDGRSTGRSVDGRDGIGVISWAAEIAAQYAVEGGGVSTDVADEVEMMAEIYPMGSDDAIEVVPAGNTCIFLVHGRGGHAAVSVHLGASYPLVPPTIMVERHTSGVDPDGLLTECIGALAPIGENVLFGLATSLGSSVVLDQMPVAV